MLSVLLIPLQKHFIQESKGKTWDGWLEAIQSIDNGKFSHTTGTLSKTFHNPVGEVNPHVRFGYVPQTIFNHNLVQVSLSTNADPVNEKYTNQLSSKEVLYKYLEGYFISSKTNYQSKNQLHPTGILATTFINPVGEANPCFQFGYGPQTFFNHTWVQV